MEVSNVRDHVTHATISGNKAIDFGISDSPEFFHILSSTLYSDQPLAVVREVLCNAWDAHIEAGCANKPVEVTLNTEELIIRDFGRGIHDDDIGPVYGVYGGSTKKKNKLVTGGFGLGCKAPFAYTDHFEVTSWHAGRRTIYNMSKSSAEVNGRPGIVPIASFPTDETGLQVRIQLKDRNDRHRFEQLVRRIAANGEMSVVLNGVPIDVLPFSSMKHGFMVTRLPVLENSSHTVLVRYGHVVYPVDNHADYAEDYKEIRDFLSTLPDNGSKYKIIFQAKPDSISVTPSRESLSMQEHTINTLTQIFQEFRQFLRDRALPERLNILQEAIIETWTTMKPGELFSNSETIPGLNRNSFMRRDDVDVMVELPQMFRAQMSWNYPKTNDFRFNDLLTRVNSVIEAKFGNVGLVKSYRSELLRQHRLRKPTIGWNRTTISRFNEPSSWLHRKVIWPMIRDLKAAELNTKRLLVYGASGDDRNFRWNETFFREAASYPCRKIEDQLPFLRNIVVLTHNREGIEERVPKFPIMKHWLGKSSNFLCYVVPRTSKAITDKAREFFESRGVELIDLTVYHSWETPPTPAPKSAVKEKPKPKAKGLPILGCLLNGGIRVDFLWHDDEAHDIQRTEAPKVVARIPRREERVLNISDFDEEETIAICSLWSREIGVAINQGQFDKYQKDGAIPLDNWVREQVSAEILSNTRIHQALASDPERITTLDYQHTAKDFFEVVWSVPELCMEFGLTNNLTETDKHYLRLWEHYDRYFHRQHYPEVEKAHKFVSKIKTDPAAMKLSKLLLERRTYLDALRPGHIRRNLLSDVKGQDSAKLKPVIDTTKQIVLLALKG